MHGSGSSVIRLKRSFILFHFRFSIVGHTHIILPLSLDGTPHPDKPLFLTASVKKYPELISSKQAQWNKCLILWSVCTSLKTNGPLYEGQRIDITKPVGNKARYHLAWDAEQSHKSFVNAWKSPSVTVSSKLPRLGEPSWMHYRCHVSLRSSDFDWFNCISRLLPISLLCPSIFSFVFKLTACIHSEQLTKVTVFKMQENINSSWIVHQSALKKNKFFLTSSTMRID